MMEIFWKETQKFWNCLNSNKSNENPTGFSVKNMNTLMSHLNNSWAVTLGQLRAFCRERTFVVCAIKHRYQQIPVLFSFNAKCYKNDRDNWAAKQTAKMLSSTYKLDIQTQVYLHNYLVMNIMSSSISVKYPGLQNWSFCQLYDISFHLLNWIFLFPSVSLFLILCTENKY